MAGTKLGERQHLQAAPTAKSHDEKENSRPNFCVASCRDMGTLDAYGYLQIKGRIKDMIIRGGENIYPAEIEQFLHKHPKIKEAQVRSHTRDVSQTGLL